MKWTKCLSYGKIFNDQNLYFTKRYLILMPAIARVLQISPCMYTKLEDYTRYLSDINLPRSKASKFMQKSYKELYLYKQEDYIYLVYLSGISIWYFYLVFLSSISIGYIYWVFLTGHFYPVFLSSISIRYILTGIF